MRQIKPTQGKKGTNPSPFQGKSQKAAKQQKPQVPLTMTKKEKMKIFALETIGNLLEVVNDKGEE